jgi:predicted nuclease of predicted toxin-antitoxin system
LKVLLDENFPLALLRSLLRDGQQAEHIITMGWRGASDQQIRERLVDRSVLFLTQDEDFLLDKPTAATVSPFGRASPNLAPGNPRARFHSTTGRTV